MKIIKTASGKKTIKISKKEWQSIGKTAGWGEDYDYDSPEQQRNRDMYDTARESLQDEGVEDPSDEQVEAQVQEWASQSERESAKQSVKKILEQYDYDINRINAELTKAESDMEGLNEKEDWQAEFYPSQQGSIDAQDFKADSMQGQSSKIADLERALELLNFRRK